MGKLKSSLTNHQCQLQGFGQGMKQNLAVYVVSLFQAQWDRYHEQNHLTQNYVVTSCIEEREINDRDTFLSFLL